MIAVADLKDAVDAWMAAIRHQHKHLPDLTLTKKLALLWQPGMPQNQDDAVDAILVCAREQLDTDLAQLVKCYYWQHQSVQAIKNNRKLPQSVATLWRRLRDALELMAVYLHKEELTARSTWKSALYTKLPLRAFDVLFGRDADVDTLIIQLTSPKHWLINLTGLGGIGKTSTAQVAVRQLIESLQVQNLIWLEIEPSKQQENIPTAQSLADKLVMQLLEQFNNIGSIAATPRQRLAQLRPLLKARSYLIVVDNIEAVHDDGQLSKQLYSLTNPAKFLLISRRRLKAEQPIRTVQLYPITKWDATSYIRDRADKLGVMALAQASDALLTQIHTVLGGHPQALRLFVQMSIHHSVSSILAEFEGANVQDIETLYETIYHRSWANRSDCARRMLDALHLVPVGGADKAYLGIFSGLDKNASWSAIRELSDTGLIDCSGDAQTRHYAIHSLTSSFLTMLIIQGERGEIEQKWIDEQLLAACRYWQAQVSDGVDKLLDLHHPYLIKLARVGLRNPAGWQPVVGLMLALYPAIANSFYGQEWLAVFQMALEYAMDEAHPLQYLLCSRFGTLYYAMTDYAKAAEMHQQALLLAQSLNDVKGVGREHVHLCITGRFLNQYGTAAEHGQTALDIFDELQLHPHFQLAALNALGQNAFAQADFKAADSHFAKAAKVGRNAVPNGAMTRLYNNWGDVLRLWGKHDRAHKKYQQAQRLNEQTTSALSHVMLNVSLCSLYLDTGRMAKAGDIIDQPTFSYEVNGMPSFHAAKIAECTGRYFLLRNELEQAILHLENAIQYWEMMAKTPRLGISILLLAEAHHLAGNKARALAAQQRAEALFSHDYLAGWEDIYKRQYTLQDGFQNTSVTND